MILILWIDQTLLLLILYQMWLLGEAPEEIVTAVREKKPVFVSMEGGKAKTPLWMLGMFPHKYIYNSLDEIMEMLYAIDSGNKEIDSDRWRLLQKKYR